MKNKLTIEWLYAAVIRAIKTSAQTALGMFTVGSALNEVNWTYVLSVSAVSAIYSLLTSLATKLPEVTNDGTLQVDTTDPFIDRYVLSIDDDLSKITSKSHIRLKVSPFMSTESQEERTL